MIFCNKNYEENNYLHKDDDNDDIGYNFNNQMNMLDYLDKKRHDNYYENKKKNKNNSNSNNNNNSNKEIEIGNDWGFYIDLDIDKNTTISQFNKNNNKNTIVNQNKKLTTLNYLPKINEENVEENHKNNNIIMKTKSKMYSIIKFCITIIVYCIVNK